jgi:GNAT superfamily N-acetyltransferase
MAMAEPSRSLEAFTADLAREAQSLGITPRNLLAGAGAVVSPVSFLGNEVVRGVHNELSGAPASDRGTQMPIANWPDGPGLAVPQTLIDAKNAFARFHRGEAPQPQDAVLAGLVMSGGLGAIRPTGSLGMFGGRLANTADRTALAKAEEMAAKGAGRDDIWNSTGWFQGADGKWRFEIDDSGMKHAVPLNDWIPKKEDGRPLMAPNVETAFNKAAETLTPQAPMRAKRLFEHPELDAAYRHGFTDSPDHPGIMGMPVQLMEGGNASAALIGGKTIGLHETLPPGTAKSSMLHELQHAVQGREGFAPGGTEADFIYQNSPLFNQRRSYESPADAYRRVAGEVEARNVQSRMNMSADERRATPPWKTQDVADADQIIRGTAPEVQNSILSKLLGRSVAGTERAAAPSGLPSISAEAGRFDFTPGTPRTADVGRSSLSYLPEDGMVELTALGTPEAYRGQGAATQAMQRFTGALDEAGLPSRLVARGDAGTDPTRLQGFYQAHGYGPPGSDGYMVRPAKPTTGETLFSNPKDAAPVGVLPAMANAGERKGITAYHGSPHDFDRFDIGKAGSGEGGQNFGFGHYFADEEAVAKNYERARDAGKFAQRLERENPQLFATAKAETDKIYEGAGYNEIGDWLADLRRVPERFEPDLVDSMMPYVPGRTYEVNLGVTPEALLNWDRPLANQPSVLNALAPHLENFKGDAPIPDNAVANALTGADAYKAMAEKLGEKEAAQWFNELGVPGIRYLDGKSRGQGQGTSNYTIFDDSLIDIKRKYANPPNAAPGGLLATGEGESDADILRKYGWLGQAAGLPVDNFLVQAQAQSPSGRLQGRGYLDKVPPPTSRHLSHGPEQIREFEAYMRPRIDALKAIGIPGTEAEQMIRAMPDVESLWVRLGQEGQQSPQLHEDLRKLLDDRR